MHSEKAFTRKNLMVNRDQIRTLKQLLGATTESEAVRIAIRDRVALEEAQAAFQRIRARGGVDDVFGRSAADGRKTVQ